MPTLYSYVVATDSGAAPNPFGGVCTLVICKPQIRRAAQIGDWIVGTGSANSPIGDIRGQVVYAMRVSAKMTMADYDDLACSQLPVKVPGGDSPSSLSKVGDAIYDFSEPPPRLRSGSVHCEGDRDRDLGGEFALLSEHFYYFGAQPRPLPDYLWPIVKEGQGHRSNANKDYVDDFIEWIEGLDAEPNHLHGKPAELKDFGGFEEALAQIESSEIQLKSSKQSADRWFSVSSDPSGPPLNPDVSAEELGRLKTRSNHPNARTAAYICGMLVREQSDAPSHEALVTSANLAVLQAWDCGVDLSNLDAVLFEVLQAEGNPPHIEIQRGDNSVCIPVTDRSFSLKEPWNGFYRLSKVFREAETKRSTHASDGTSPMETVWQNRRNGESLCKGCPGQDSPYPLGGLGNPDSDLMLVAKEPNYNVNRDTVRSEMPWSEAKQAMEQDRRDSMNPLWQQMTMVAEAAGLGGPTDLYVTNPAKCNDRESQWKERYDHCRGYFLQELETVSPKVILLYGRHAIDATYDLYKLDPPPKIKKVHAQPQEVPGRTLVPLFHWAHAMRSGWIDRYKRQVAEVVREIYSG